MKARALLAASLLSLSLARADEHGEAIFVGSPARPFLLLDARRRYLPREHAHAFVQRRGGGALSLSVFRVGDSRAFVEASVSAQGVSTAAGPWGEECESLLRQRGALPRAGARLTLIQQRQVQTAAPPTPRRAIGDEGALYDSNEDDEGMAETWGVSARGWGVADVDLGALAAGTYLLRAQDGMFATSALLSVGETVVILRRGDAHDAVRVSDAEGRGLADVAVEAVAGSEIVRARTNSAGEASVPASDAPTRRVYATRGDELAWSEVTHARLPPCDTRIYLATGRPVYRPGEAVQVRGHVRGCGPSAGARVRLRPAAEGGEGESVTADADGNFVATLSASETIYAEHEGRTHARTLHLDARPVPGGTLRLHVDRPWAPAGQRVTVTATPSDGIDLRAVRFSWRGGAETVAATAGAPSSASFVMPTTSSAIERFTVRATAVGASETLHAEVGIWTGRHRELLSLDAGEVRGVEGEELSISLRANDLGGAPSPGPLRIEVLGSDGNRAVGPVRWAGEATVPASGALSARVRLAGRGPWWLRALRGEALAEGVVWERARPASLSASGPLALRPDRAYVAPGEALEVALRAAGPVWVTLEQGGVWASRLATPGRDGMASVRFDPPPGARGLATLVATRVHEGRVELATAVTEVATSQRFVLTAEPDRRSYANSATARVIVRARTTSGAPKNAVVSMWLEDAGWWALGEERHPSVDAYFRATGRPASGGDSTHPLGFGSEEGRRSDSGMFWNGERVPGTTYRHAWGHGSAVVNLRVRGDLSAVAAALARAAGLNGAAMCPARVRPAGTVDLEVRELPWDLAAARLATRTNTWVRRDAGGLRFACAQPADSGRGLGGYGSGRGAGGVGSGALGARVRDREQLWATQWFLPLRRLGPTGEATVEVPLPAAPGRWRLHTLAIGDDGAGAEANADFDTAQPVTATLRLPRALAPGDVVEAELRVRRSDALATPLSARVDSQGGLRAEPAGFALSFDAEGSATQRLRVTALRAGAGAITATVAAGGGPIDAVRAPITVRDDHAEQAVDYRAVLGSEPTDIDLPIPPLAAPAELRIELDGSLVQSAQETLATLREPRWRVGALQLDRYASLRALESLAATQRGPEAAALSGALRDELRGAATELRALCGSDGELAWWSQMQGSHALTATALALGAAEGAAWPEGWEGLRGAAPSARDGLAARVAAALSRGAAADRALAASLIDRVSSNDLDSLSWALRAAQSLRDAGRARRIAERLGDAIDRTISNDLPVECAGAAWFLCLSREGTRGAVAFAARTLLEAHPPSRGRALRAARWLSSRPEERRLWSWGTAEGEVLALLARIGPSAGAGGRFTAQLGGAALGQGDARAGLRVTVSEAGTLRLAFAAAPGRWTRVRVTGTLRVAPPSQSVGPASLVRGFEGAGQDRAMVLSFTLPEDATGVEIHAPIPAGLELAMGAEGPAAQRDPRQGWRELDGPAGDTRARVTRLDDGVRVRFARLRAGAHRLRVPLVSVAAGDFHAGSAWMRAEQRGVWSVTPAWRATLR